MEQFDDLRELRETISSCTRALTESISSLPVDRLDDAGNSVGCLTEACIGITAGLVKIAEVLESANIGEHLDRVVDALGRVEDAIRRHD